MAKKKHPEKSAAESKREQRALPFAVPKQKAPGEPMKKFVLRVPVSLCDSVDQWMHWAGYKSRNEFIVAALRSTLNSIIKSQRGKQ